MSGSDRPPFEPPSVAVLPRLSLHAVAAASAEADEPTPTETPFSIRVMNRLDKFDRDFEEMKGHCRAAAQRSLETLELVQSLTGKVAQIERRVTSLELANRWVPRFAWAVTTAIALIALLRTYR